ncbi:siderophore-interacting protein [Cognatishimia activa]|uniref:Siderophore-interacting protein n=1 Tax=Cognatishimia activa TaxID=1715691 RepID=A0A975ENU1_9RHOB|nr:siderophore-interacting protein [Cognatishimia activa]QTN35389.1 siderophore-interacting protein [Cognatishimia activa]
MTTPKPKKPLPRVLTVKKAWHLTPHMIRVTFSSPELEGFPEGREGANCKLMIPEPGEARDAFVERLANGPAPSRRTYTVRAYRPEVQELDIDFVDHGPNGPASAWAINAQPGSFLGFSGPGPVKVKDFYADWYLVAADPSALPVAAAALEAMPRDAKGIAIFEIPSEDDRYPINAPEGVEIHWRLHEDAHTPSKAQVDFIRNMDWPDGTVQTCIAGEAGVVKALRTFLLTEKQLPKKDAYIAGYWKIGLVEDEHQIEKRAEA